MRNKVIKTISILLVFVISFLALSSCGLINGNLGWTTGDNGHSGFDFYPEGYTGGFPDAFQPGVKVEFWWVETYDDCLAAIELLKSHGSTFDENAIFTYEGDLFDTKYCFVIGNNDRFTEEIEFGDNPFDRKAWKVRIESYAFFDDVTIEEINYGDIENYTVFRFSGRHEEIKKEDLHYCEWEFSYGKNGCYIVDGKQQATFYVANFCNTQDENDVLPDESLEAILTSMKWIDEYGVKE